jgi:hypothetical protein
MFPQLSRIFDAGGAGWLWFGGLGGFRYS